MSRGKELLKNTAIVAVGKICTKFLSFFLLPFYTAVLSTEDYGIVDLLNTYISLLLPLIIFQIEDALFRFTIDARDSENEKKKIISTAMYFCMMQSVLFSIIYAGVQFLIEIPYKEYLWLNVLVSIYSGTLLQVTRGLGDNYTYAFGSFLTAVSAIVSNIILVLGFHMGAEGLFISAFFSNLIGIIYFIYKKKIYRFVHIKYFDKNLLKNMLQYSLPLVPNYLSWWVVGASDKSIVSYFLGISQNGILSVAQKFSTTYTNFYSIFNLTWTEHASVHKSDMDREQYYSYIIETAFRILSSACLCMTALIAVIFPFLINEKFAEAYYQVPIYMLSSFLYSIIGIYSVVYVAEKKTGEVAKTSVIAAVVNVTVNILLIQYIGLYAASLSSVTAYAVMFFIRYVDIKKYIHIHISRSMVLSVIFMMLINFIVYYKKNNIISILYFVCVCFYALYINRNLLKELQVLMQKKKGNQNEK